MNKTAYLAILNENLVEMHKYLRTLHMSDDARMLCKGSIFMAQHEASKNISEIDTAKLARLQDNIIVTFNKFGGKNK